MFRVKEEKEAKQAKEEKELMKQRQKERQNKHLFSIRKKMDLQIHRCNAADWDRRRHMSILENR